MIFFTGPALVCFSQHRSIFPTEENLAWSLCSLALVALGHLGRSHKLHAARNQTKSPAKKYKDGGMMEKKRSVEITLVGIFAVILGIWMLIRYGYFSVYTLSHFSETVNAIGSLWTILSILYSLVFISFFFGGIAILFLKIWGKFLVYISLVIDILARLSGIIKYWYVWFTLKKPIVIPEGSHVAKASMIPTHLIFITEIIALYFIARPKVKEQFK